MADLRVVIAHNEAAFTQGEQFRGLYIVVSGYLKLRESRADGTERIVALRAPGDLVGLEGWARGEYLYSAIATGGARLCRLPWPVSAHSASSPLLEQLLRKASAQLERTARQWAGLSAVERVAAFLGDLQETGRVRSPGSELDRLPITRAEIGSYLGLAEETVVRAIAQLRKREEPVPAIP